MTFEKGENHQNIKKQIQIDSEEYSKILDSGLKVRILMMLLIFPELSLTQLSKKMKKAKSTISKHMSELIELGLVTMREQHIRGSIKQKLYSAAKKRGYWGRTYKDLKKDSPDVFLKHLHEEFLINLRLFSYIQEVSQYILHYITKFYPNLTADDVRGGFIEEIYRYNTCVPRIKFLTKDEYIDYRKKFIKFDEDYLKKMELNRVKNPNNDPKEYLVVHELIPIRRVLDFALSENDKK